ncbi:MAG: PadR family transcriptional regulator [Desulfovibrionaceae bacterium]
MMKQSDSGQGTRANKGHGSGKGAGDGSGKGRGRGKAERYMQPCILLALLEKPTYGYELLKDIKQYGFIEGQTPPGMLYRHLRQMEEDGLVASHWETEESGPAKRMYTISDAGHEALLVWQDYMRDQIGKLERFIARYHDLSR